MDPHANGSAPRPVAAAVSQAAHHTSHTSLSDGNR